jgi:hypothetical protein
VCEFAGAVGLILPAATTINPGLTALAATGLLAIMVLAVPFHISRGETTLIAAPADPWSAGRFHCLGPIAKGRDRIARSGALTLARRSRRALIVQNKPCEAAL